MILRFTPPKTKTECDDAGFVEAIHGGHEMRGEYKIYYIHIRQINTNRWRGTTSDDDLGYRLG